MIPKEKLILFSIFILALLLRVYGLNWDQSQHLHPDERFLTMVSTAIKLPSSLSQYFDTAASPLNPYNYKDYQFFVYGTLPLFLTKIVAAILHLSDYDHLVLVGRFLSAVFDASNIISLYFLSRLIIKKYLFLPGILYTFCLLPLQLSHFFAVDTYLTFFTLLTFTLLAYNLFPLAAVSFGLALASKISALYFAPIIFFFFLFKYLKTRKLFPILLSILYSLCSVFIIFRIFQPYSFIGLFKINPQFISNLKTLESFSDPTAWFPPAVQWLSKTPLLYSLQNIVFWGIGLPLSFVFLFSLFKLKKLHFNSLSFLIIFWVIFLYFYQGSQFAHTMRYFLPIYPFICLAAAYLLTAFPKKIITTFVVCHLVFGLLFISIYTRPHSRVQASDWIYQNIPSGSILTNEYWDDPLPQNLPGFNSNMYIGLMISPYDPDNQEKIQKLFHQINSANYVIMSSNRLWGSIPLATKIYPLTAKFYQDLFAEKLGFKKLIEINSYPGLPLPFLNKCYYLGPTNFPGIQNKWFEIDYQCNYPGVYLRDDTAEEAFTVYDHPKVLIFQRKK